MSAPPAGKPPPLARPKPRPDHVRCCESHLKVAALGGRGRLNGSAPLELAEPPLGVALELLPLSLQRDPLPNPLLRLLLQPEHHIGKHYSPVRCQLPPMPLCLCEPPAEQRCLVPLRPQVDTEPLLLLSLPSKRVL